MMNEKEIKRARLGVWLALIVPAIAWFAQLNLSYLLAAHSCHERTTLLHIISILAIVVSVVSLFIGWKSFRSMKEGGAWFLGILSFGGLLLLIIIAGEYSNLVLEPCQ